jgi:hypothetical protein
MPLHRWRRDHGLDLNAQVHPTDDARWAASAWQGATCAHTHRWRFRLLTDAQANADTLVAEQFNHECDPAHCGQWHPVRK